MHYFRTIALFIALIPFISCTNTPKGRGFAIIIDPQSYQQAKSELEAYATSIEADGLKTFIIEDTWKNPDSIKSQLIKLYSQKKFPIEGAVFIGDIPIAMVRDAQHMTSAFKMDQDRYAWNRSSIPTDRFYDDFDLKFKFLKQDSLNSKLFYYALAPESTQKLQPEIYTGRIKPFNTPDKYKHLRAYLSKVVTEKQKQNTLNQVLYFGGHGYMRKLPCLNSFRK
jgi:hypothetical protein